MFPWFSIDEKSVQKHDADKGDAADLFECSDAEDVDDDLDFGDLNSLFRKNEANPVASSRLAVNRRLAAQN